MFKLIDVFIIGLVFGSAILVCSSAYFLIRAMVDMLQKRNYIGFAIIVGIFALIISAAGFMSLML